MGMPLPTRSHSRPPFSDFSPPSVSFWSCMPLSNGTSMVRPRRMDPWLCDGNVVLAAEGVCFRVHRRMLSSASRVFHNMFSLPTHGFADRKVDGCPVVTLHDAASEVQIVLQTLYTKPQRIPTEAPIHVSMLTAFLRLGKKYEIRWLFDEACSRIKQCYPSSLFTLLFLPPDLKHPITGRDKYDFLLINLAREFGLFSVLPVALYRCICASPLAAILDGYLFDGASYHLTPANQKSCILGRDKLLELQSLTFSWLKVQRPFCTDEVKCALGNFSTIAELWCPDRPSYRDPFMRWDPRWDSRFCSNCTIYCHREIEDGREDAWIGLPRAFGFCSWEQLSKEENYEADF